MSGEEDAKQGRCWWVQEGTTWRSTCFRSPVPLALANEPLHKSMTAWSKGEEMQVGTQQESKSSGGGLVTIAVVDRIFSAYI